MVRKLTSKTFLILLVIIIAVIVGWMFIKGNNKIGKVTYPEYMNFDGNYVFSSPKDYQVDEHSLEGAVLVYKAPIAATPQATATDLINAGAMSVEPIKDLNDHSDKAFKNYVNGTLITQLKKNLNTNNVQVKFERWNDQITAALTIDNGNQPYRWAKGGQHPAVLVTKKNDANSQTIEQTLTDIEKSDLKNQADSIKSLIQSTAQSAKNQQAHDLYTSASNDFKSQTTEAKLMDALKAAVPYTGGDITISGISYTPTDFAIRMKMVKLDKNDQTPGFGGMGFKKVNGQWQLSSLTLPTPKS